ncbi:MAG TPA: hypothetical protein VG433_16925 [Pirellulales bacterium]|jgi:hypothetical protein|nr:hypothetical protein [Pirellulales bacterium]
MPQQKQITGPMYKCPHCGWRFGRLKDGLVPVHFLAPELRSDCPGSRQTARNALTDNRPLWKDEGVPQKAAEVAKGVDDG